MTSLKLRFLSSPRVAIEENIVQISRRKALALLIYLAVNDTDQRRDTLATLLWPDASQQQARAALRRHLSELRRLLGPEWLQIDGEIVRLRMDPALWLDVTQFRQHLAVCRGHNHPSDTNCTICLDHLVQAAALYEADFLTGFSLSDCIEFDEWQFFEAESLRQELAWALERLIHLQHVQGTLTEAISHARRWLALDPLHEAAHQALMALYAQTGQQAAALRQYRLCAQMLEEELGVVPSVETQTLHERIKAGKSIDETGKRLLIAQHFETPPLMHNLPTQTTPFVGRETELAELARLFDDPTVRLLTILGPGGIGKTRLALAAAEVQLDHFLHGVRLVSLAPIEDPEQLLSAISEAVDCPSQSDGWSPRQQLLDYLGQKQLLLILDNIEHLLAGVAVVNDILQAAPKVRVLTTSRERLLLSGETVFSLAGMTYPKEDGSRQSEDYDAVRLFVQSAGRVRPGFKPTPEETAAIVRICRIVEGMPLGVELAAAWMIPKTTPWSSAGASSRCDIM